ncbi:MAG: hypothetical protein K6E61_01755 [Bacteroidales bacterium]|nr:hypothetical protein [Bacteroidales bacterium]
MSKSPYTPPVTDVEVIYLELNLLASQNATGANVTFDTGSDFDSYFGS